MVYHCNNHAYSYKISLYLGHGNRYYMGVRAGERERDIIFADEYMVSIYKIFLYMSI